MRIEVIPPRRYPDRTVRAPRIIRHGYPLDIRTKCMDILNLSADILWISMSNYPWGTDGSTWVCFVTRFAFALLGRHQSWCCLVTAAENSAVSSLDTPRLYLNLMVMCHCASLRRPLWWKVLHKSEIQTCKLRMMWRGKENEWKEWKESCVCKTSYFGSSPGLRDTYFWIEMTETEMRMKTCNLPIVRWP